MSDCQTVIIADDSSIFRSYFSTLLGRMNFDVMPVASGHEALNLARVVTPQLITLDIRMAGLDGLATLQQLQADAALADIPVLMISGHADHAEACFAGGCTDFLTKPINLGHLHTALQKCQSRPGGTRRHLRAAFNRTVSYVHAGRPHLCRAVTLSEGGIFLQTEAPLPTGSRLEVDLPLGKKEAMLICGEVIYTVETQQRHHTLPTGMAIRFDDCVEATRQRLQAEVRDLLAGDILDEQSQAWFCSD